MKPPLRWGDRAARGCISPVLARLLLCAFSGLSGCQLGCRMYSSELPLALELPELPEHWRECLGRVAWLVVVPGSETTVEIPAGCTEVPTLVLPKLQHQPVLAFPTLPSGEGRLPPAAGVFPLDLSADGHALLLRWEQGPVGEILSRLVRQGLDLETLNVSRLCREVLSRFPADPWALDLNAAAAELVSGSFSVTDLRPLGSRALELEAGPGYWFLESPFFVPVAAAAEPPPTEMDADIRHGLLVLPEVPLGFHRLFELNAGWVADLWVDERTVLWMPSEGPPSPRPRARQRALGSRDQS